MKYQKPQILFESFEMSTSIAATCNYVQTKTLNYEMDCAVYPIDIPSMRIFDRGVEASTCTTDPVGVFDDLCYQVPNDAYNIYTSY